MRKKRNEYGPSEGQSMIRGLANAAREAQREESTKKSTGDHIVDALIRMGKPLTVENWVSLNYWDRTRESLEGEELAELEKLIEAGLLVDTHKKHEG